MTHAEHLPDPESAGGPAVGRSSPEAFHRTLGDLIRGARGVDAELFVVDPARARAELVPRLRGLAERAIDILRNLEGHVSDAAEGDGRRAWARATATLAPRGALEEVENLCFFAAAELREGVRLLDGLSEDDAFAAAAVAEWTQGRLIQGLCAVETRLSELIGRPARSRHVDLIRDALVARRLLVGFRSRVEDVVERADAPVAGLRSAGAAIAWLLGNDGARSLRASDRIMVLTLQGRLSEALRSGVGKAAAVHLLQEVVSFASLTAMVNNRQVLLAHDRVVLRRAASALATADVHEPVSPEVAAKLASACGRDAELDRLLDVGAEAGEVRRRVEHVLSGLVRTSGVDRAMDGPEATDEASCDAGEAPKRSRARA